MKALCIIGVALIIIGAAFIFSSNVPRHIGEIVVRMGIACIIGNFFV